MANDDAFEAALTAGDTRAENVSANDSEIGGQVAVDVETKVEPEIENDENAEFRNSLRNAPGEWFVVHSYAGYEKKVKGNLLNRIQSLNMEDFVFQIEVPEEEITEVKNARELAEIIQEIIDD